MCPAGVALLYAALRVLLAARSCSCCCCCRAAAPLAAESQLEGLLLGHLDGPLGDAVAALPAQQRSTQVQGPAALVLACQAAWLGRDIASGLDELLPRCTRRTPPFGCPSPMLVLDASPPWAMCTQAFAQLAEAACTLATSVLRHRFADVRAMRTLRRFMAALLPDDSEAASGAEAMEEAGEQAKAGPPGSRGAASSNDSSSSGSESGDSSGSSSSDGGGSAKEEGGPGEASSGSSSESDGEGEGGRGLGSQRRAKAEGAAAAAAGPLANPAVAAAAEQLLLRLLAHSQFVGAMRESWASPPPLPPAAQALPRPLQSLLPLAELPPGQLVPSAGAALPPEGPEAAAALKGELCELVETLVDLQVGAAPLCCSVCGCGSDGARAGTPAGYACLAACAAMHAARAALQHLLAERGALSDSSPLPPARPPMQDAYSEEGWAPGAEVEQAESALLPLLMAGAAPALPCMLSPCEGGLPRRCCTHFARLPAQRMIFCLAAAQPLPSRVSTQIVLFSKTISHALWPPMQGTEPH